MATQYLISRVYFYIYFHLYSFILLAAQCGVWGMPPPLPFNQEAAGAELACPDRQENLAVGITNIA